MGLTVYHVDSQSYELIDPTESGQNARWLPDSRRLMYVHDGKIHLIDSQSKRTHQLFAAGPRRNILSFGLSGDGRWIAFTVEVAEADIWLINLE